MDVTTALFTAANALHNNYATTAEREASRGEQASSSGDGRPDDPEEQKLLDEINSCERMLDDMKKDAEESGSVIKKIMCFLTEVIVDVDGDFMTEAPRARLRLYKLQHDTPKVIRDGLKLLQDYRAGKPLDSNDVHSYLKMLDQWGPHVTGTMAGLAGVRGNLKGRQAFRPNAQAHKPGCASGHEFKPQSLTVEALGLEGVGRSTPGRISKEQPWTVRDGQEWKEKVVGRAQKTGTDGHSFRSYREAIKAAKQEDVDKVLLNRGVNRVLDEKIRPNRRPDVTVVRKTGRIDQVEVPSRTDDVDLLRKRMDDTSNYFPRSRVGKNDIKDISGGN